MNKKNTIIGLCVLAAAVLAVLTFVPVGSGTSVDAAGKPCKPTYGYSKPCKPKSPRPLLQKWLDPDDEMDQ